MVRCEGEGRLRDEAYQVQTGAAAEILHDDPQLVTAEEASLVLGHKGASAWAEDGDLALYLLDVVIARFEVDLGDTLAANSGGEEGMLAHMFYGDGLACGLLDALVDDAEAPP